MGSMPDRRISITVFHWRWLAACRSSEAESAVSSLDVLLSEGGFLPYTIVRTLSDGQQVLVGACEDLKEVRKIIEELSKYWPGNYAILYRHSRQPVVPNLVPQGFLWVFCEKRDETGGQTR